MCVVCVLLFRTYSCHARNQDHSVHASWRFPGLLSRSSLLARPRVLFVDSTSSHRVPTAGTRTVRLFSRRTLSSRTEVCLQSTARGLLLRSTSYGTTLSGATCPPRQSALRLPSARKRGTRSSRPCLTQPLLIGVSEGERTHTRRAKNHSEVSSVLRARAQNATLRRSISVCKRRRTREKLTTLPPPRRTTALPHRVQSFVETNPPLTSTASRLLHSPAAAKAPCGPCRAKRLGLAVTAIL
jgi:hypothetical protein